MEGEERMTRKNINSLFQFKNTEFIMIFLFFTSIILVLSLSGYTFLGIQDEVQLQSTLSAGDPKNYMISYPLNVFLTMLYAKMPEIPWYSVLMLLYIWLISLLMTIYIAKFDYSKFLKWIMLLLFTLLLIFMLFEVSVTLLTLLLIAFAVPLIKNHQIFFWFLLYLASFLRVELILSVLPLVILGYLLQINKKSFSQKNILVIILFITAISVNHLSSSLNKEYSEWLEFTKSRLYFTDLAGIDKHQILSNDEFQLSRTWWICDLDIYPVAKIPQAAGSTLDIVLQRVLNPKNIKRLLRKLYYNKFLILLLLFTAYIVYIEKNNLRRTYYILFALGFLSLILVKDTQRTTFPLMLMWSLLFFFELLEKRKNLEMKGLLFVLLLFVTVEIPWTKVTQYQKNERLVSEFKDLINRNNMELEISSGFTASWDLTIKVLMQGHLLYEKDWVDYRRYLLLSGWFTMHPLCLKQHDITFKNTKRKYNTYYEYLLDKKTGIIGDLKGKAHINPFLANNLLRMYDEKFVKEPGCNHKVRIVDHTEYFAIRQIVKVCDENASGHNKEKRKF